MGFKDNFAKTSAVFEEARDDDPLKNLHVLNAGTGNVDSAGRHSGIDDATKGAMHGAMAGNDAPQFQDGIMRAGLGYGMQSRADQNAATAQLQAAAAGEVPSAAEIQMQQGTDQALRAQLAAANSAKGGTGAQLQAALGAQQQGAQMSAQAVQNASALRAQEMAGARQALSGHLAGVRGADLQTAGLGLEFAGAAADNELGQRQLDASQALGFAGLGTQQDQFANNFWLDQEQTRIDTDLARAGIVANKNAADNAATQQAWATGLGAVTGLGSAGLGMLGPKKAEA